MAALPDVEGKMLRRFYPLFVCLIALPIASGSTAEVKIAILDSGCNIEYEEGVSFVDDTPADLNGHGTTIAKIIKEINPNAKLYIAKVFGEFRLNSDITDFVKAMHWAISREVDLINFSWQFRGDVRTIHDAIQEAYRRDIIMVAAAGTIGGDPLNVLIDELCKRSGEQIGVRYPAKYDEVIAVGAIRSSWGLDKHGKYSPTGPEIEFVCNGSYGSQKGTSFAAAYATAITARIRADYPHLDAARLREGLQLCARDLGDKGRDIEFGYGRLDASLQNFNPPRGPIAAKK